MTTLATKLGDNIGVDHKLGWQPMIEQTSTRHYWPTLGLLFLTTTAVVAQTNYQWTQSRSGSWPTAGIAVAPTTPATVIAADGFSIYRSTSVGANWSACNYPFATFPGDALTFDPTNPTIVYGGRAHGMIKSIDGGANWFHLPNLNAGRGARAIVVDPSNSSVIYVGCPDGWGVYKSSDGGSTWSNPLSSRDVQALAIDPVNPSTIYAGTKTYYNQTGGVLRSTDGGLTWASVWPFADINALAVDPVNSQVVYAGAEVGGVMKSTNGGFTWAAVANGPANIPISTVIVHPSNAGWVYASTRGNGIYVSTDAGFTWTNVSSGLTDPYCLCMALHSPSGLLFVGTYSGSLFIGMPQLVAATATSFGLGCGAPVLTLAPTPTALPRINATARASLVNAPTSPAFVALGWSSTSAGPFPLPMPLALYGMPGCNLLQSADLGSRPLTPTGPTTAAYSLPLPNWGGLLGLHIYLQGWAVAPGANSAAIILSNGVEWVIGM